VLWGSNAREAHPIFFHHVLKALRRGAKLYVVDPRRTSTAQWADTWLGLDVGSDIALANAIAREIIHTGLVNEEFIDNATTGFDEFRQSVEPYTLELAEQITGVPADAIQRLARDYASADKAQICWTLGITEHHNAVDNVLALINLALITGHVGRYGSGLCPLRGQNNVQGGGDMGAIPNKLPGFLDVETDAAARARCEEEWTHTIPPRHGWHLSQMFQSMERGELRSLYVIGENPAQSEADSGHALALLGDLDDLIVQDIFLTKTAEMASIVLPASVTWVEGEGTVTSSERRVQRVRPALSAPPGAADDIAILCELAHRLGHDWGHPSAQEIWNELRRVSPMHAGMSYERLEANGGLQWPCYSDDHPGELFLHSRLWQRPIDGLRAPLTCVEHDPPVDLLSPEFPIRLTTGRRLDSFNTGVQTGGYASPLRRREEVCLCQEDMDGLGVVEGELVRVRSRRGAIEVPVHEGGDLRPGLAFMTLHFPDQVDTNTLTIDAWDPKSGTAEFKATAICVERLSQTDPQPISAGAATS
jgi:predicted molibdopterin-dependent oxidoreductase YjgC